MNHRPGSKPPPYYGSSQWAPPPPYQSTVYPPQPPQSTSTHQVATYSYYMPGMMTVPVGVSPSATYQPNMTYITNHIYQVPVEEEVKPSIEEWIPAVPSTASHLTGRALVAGHERDGSPLWVIRAKHNGHFIPGKYSVRDKTASVTYLQKDVRVQDIEVLCAQPEIVDWVPISNGTIPPNAIEGGTAPLGSTLYVGRGRYQQTVTPGKVNSKTKTCYIGVGGYRVTMTQAFEVLCRIT